MELGVLRPLGVDRVRSARSPENRPECCDWSDSKVGTGPGWQDRRIAFLGRQWVGCRGPSALRGRFPSTHDSQKHACWIAYSISAVPDEVTATLELVADSAFQIGLVSALAVLALFTIVRFTRGQPSTGWGLGFVSATLVAISIGSQPDALLLVSLCLLYGGGLVVTPDRPSNRRWTAVVGWLAVATGVVLLTTSLDVSGPAWMPLGLMVITMVVGVGLHPARGEVPTLVGPLIMVSAVGIWATVPETDMVRALVGASLALAPATVWPWRFRLSWGGALAVAGLMGWLVIEGGTPRASSVIGGWSALAVSAISARIEVRGRLRRGALIGGIHLLAVTLSARVVGMMESTGWAALCASILATTMVGFAMAMNRRPGPRHDGSGGLGELDLG